MKGIIGTPTHPLFLSGKIITDGMEDTYVTAQDISMKRSFKVLGANKFSSHAECNMSKDEIKAFMIQKVAEAQPDKLDTFKSGVDALLYLAGLGAICSVVYVVFSISTLYYIGYPLLVAYVGFALWRFFRFAHYQYVCGHCGHPLRTKGRCPHCSTINE